MRAAVNAMRFLLVVLLVAFGGSPAWADPIVEIESRGQNVRAVLLKPANPKGAVILLAGGDGRLDITPGGEVTKLRFNQLVRTRALYERAGYVTLVPDIAPGFKVGASGVAERYRASSAFAQDIGAMVKYLRGIVSKPIVAVGTSRGSLSVANAVAKLKAEGDRRPDAAVLTSAFLRVGAQMPGLTVFKIANGNPRALDVPTMLVWHVADACPHTSASTVPAFRTWYRGSGRTLTEKSFSGGSRPESEPCEARSPHGFYGLDPEVVGAITGFVGGL
jgi:dienelactone hydrolase